MSDDQLREDRERWLRIALVDLLGAERAIAVGGFGPSLPCYHAQQAVEKALKAGLIWSKIEPPRKHDLDLLRTLLPQTWMIHNLHPQLGDVMIQQIDRFFLFDLNKLYALVPPDSELRLAHWDFAHLNRWAGDERDLGTGRPLPQAPEADCLLALRQVRCVLQKVLDVLDQQGLDVSGYR